MRLRGTAKAGLLLVGLACAGREVRQPEGGTCFSPRQNLERASAEGAEGCACDEARDAAVCVKDATGREVALVCTAGRWHAVEDGPCWP